MKKTAITIMLLILSVSEVLAGFNFGITSGVKKKVEELDKIVDEKIQKEKEEGEDDEEKSFQFTHLPFDIQYVGGITPIGNVMGTHTRAAPNRNRPYGVERHFMYHKSTGVPYNVYAPASTTIISFRKSQGIGDYGFNFKISDTVTFRHDHLHAITDELKAKIEAQVGPITESSPFITFSEPIEVTAGELLGQTGIKPTSANWDWFVGEGSDPNPGITNPDNYVTPMGQLFKSAKSVYDYASDELKTQLDTICGYWASNTLTSRSGLPPMGECGSDVSGTLSGIWFYDKTDDTTWGPKLAGFFPHFLDPGGAISIKLAIPEIDLYGIWKVILLNTGKTNLPPWYINQTFGLVYFILDDPNNAERGFLMVQVNSDNTITIETHLNEFDPSGYTVFSSSAITLSR